MREFIKDIISIVVPILGVWIAYSGLKTWKKQLKGTTEFELARRILKSTYGVREAIRFFRAFYKFIKAYIPLEGEILSPEEQQYRQTKTDWLERVERITKELQTFEVNRLEAEVLWGQESSEVLSKLSIFCNRLFVYLKIHLDDINPETRSLGYSTEPGVFKKEMDSWLCANPKKDDVEIELNSIIKNIEDYLKKHLPKKDEKTFLNYPLKILGYLG